MYAPYDRILWERVNHPNWKVKMKKFKLILISDFAASINACQWCVVHSLTEKTIQDSFLVYCFFRWVKRTKLSEKVTLKFINNTLTIVPTAVTSKLMILKLCMNLNKYHTMIFSETGQTVLSNFKYKLHMFC